MALKITSWNIKHAERLLIANPSSTVLDRIGRVRRTIEEINPDILCIIEGPEGEQGITTFCERVLDNAWSPVFLDSTSVLDSNKKRYQILGSQWIWFIVKPALLPACKIQDPIVWQSFTGEKKWPVYYWGIEKKSSHSHYRHPQVLLFDVGDGSKIEFIGVHLKSKINQKAITRDQDGSLTGEFLREALQARVKLATEATDIRNYIIAKFSQLTSPGIFLLGDCNDGPGQDLFEESYLFFDLIQNLQGEVLVAERFFNHALFDFPGHLRWTAKFRDEILKIPASQNPLLLDHILMSQPLVRGELRYKVNEKAGKVEHEAFQRGNAGSNSTSNTSDHTPVSCVLDNNIPSQ